MTEAEAQRVMLVRAVELTDSDARLSTRADRQWATDAACAEVARSGASGRVVNEAFISRRASLAYDRLSAAHPKIATMVPRGEWTRWCWIVPLAAFVFGLASNELGADRRINILSFPLLAMLAWNAAVYLALAVHATTASRRRSVGRAHGPFTALWMRIAESAWAKRGDTELFGRIVARFAADWLPIASPLIAQRARTVLHVSAALLAAGAVAGLYVRGVAFEYLAGWESTFLDAHVVHRVLSIVLGPASLVTGIALPAVDEIARLRWSATNAGENAARWIHLYAATAALFIVIPRIGLALYSAWSATRLGRELPLPLDNDAYFRKLLAARAGQIETVRVLPYSYTLDNRAQSMLRNVFVELVGPIARVEFEAPLAYGAEDDDLGDAMRERLRASDYIVVVFNVAATPETENHGAIISSLQHELGADDARLVVVLDESRYSHRLADQPESETRVAERRLSWQALMRRYGLEAISADLDRGDARNTAQRIEAATRRDATALRNE